ncbi:MAG: helix-turn-helix domain-containing protein [Chloroflexi bacterium]|nr:helix-turn-helix domain-containing protein [Chloroflexota bacterium]
MSRHSFAELLRAFFILHGDETLTQARLAEQVGVSLTTMNNWFTGKFRPRYIRQIEKIAAELYLTAFEADVLFYCINPAWVRYQTPVSAIQEFELNKVWEHVVPSAAVKARSIDLRRIKATWQPYFYDDFVQNGHHWGLGWRDDGVCRLEREFVDQTYQLTAYSHFHTNVYLGGDSPCFTPEHYYVSLIAERLTPANNEEDGYCIFFEELCDLSHGMFRIRDDVGMFSICETRNGGDHWAVYYDRSFHPAIKIRQPNTLSMVVLGQEHHFFVNDQLVWRGQIPRLSHSRIDVGIVTGGKLPVQCRFREFKVLVPPKS